jgi:hypothetical protein
MDILLTHGERKVNVSEWVAPERMPKAPAMEWFPISHFPTMFLTIGNFLKAAKVRRDSQRESPFGA